MGPLYFYLYTVNFVHRPYGPFQAMGTLYLYLDTVDFVHCP